MPTSAHQWIANQLRKVVVWAVCFLLFALMPLIAVYIDARLSGTALTPGDLLAGGEMLLIVAAIGADTMGRVITNMWLKKKISLFHILQLLSSFLLVVFSAMGYMSLLGHKATERPVDVDFVVQVSKRFFHATWMTGIGAILVLED